MEMAIIGYGRMGREIERLASERGHRVRSIIDPVAQGAAFREITPESLAGVEVAVEFTSPDAALANIQRVAQSGVNMVVGTTGWYADIGRARTLVEEAQTGLIYAPNFAIGAGAFYEIVKFAAQVFDNLEDYDAYCHETHHCGKADSPSGTARRIGELLVEKISRKEAPVYESLNRRREPGELHVSSTRGGWVPGTHEVVFDSEFDSVELVHRARSRGGLAAGALRAAEWIVGRKGFYEFSDFLRETLGL